MHAFHVCELEGKLMQILTLTATVKLALTLKITTLSAEDNPDRFLSDKEIKKSIIN